MFTAETINNLPRFTQAEAKMLLTSLKRKEWAVITVCRAAGSLEVLFNGELEPMAVVVEDDIEAEICAEPAPKDEASWGDDDYEGLDDDDDDFDVRALTDLHSEGPTFCWKVCVFYMLRNQHRLGDDYESVYLLGDGFGTITSEEAKLYAWDWSHVRDSSNDAIYNMAHRIFDILGWDTFRKQRTFFQSYALVA